MSSAFYILWGFLATPALSSSQVLYLCQM